jgi:hypothetical protein
VDSILRLPHQKRWLKVTRRRELLTSVTCNGLVPTEGCFTHGQPMSPGAHQASRGGHLDLTSSVLTLADYPDWGFRAFPQLQTECQGLLEKWARLAFYAQEGPQPINSPFKSQRPSAKAISSSGFNSQTSHNESSFRKVQIEWRVHFLARSL